MDGIARVVNVVRRRRVLGEAERVGLSYGSPGRRGPHRHVTKQVRAGASGRYRVRSLASGSPITVDREKGKNAVTLREIATVALGYASEGLIRSMQHNADGDEPESIIIRAIAAPRQSLSSAVQPFIAAQVYSGNRSLQALSPARAGTNAQHAGNSSALPPHRRSRRLPAQARHSARIFF